MRALYDWIEQSEPTCNCVAMACTVTRPDIGQGARVAYIASISTLNRPSTPRTVVDIFRFRHKVRGAVLETVYAEPVILTRFCRVHAQSPSTPNSSIASNMCSLLHLDILASIPVVPLPASKSHDIRNIVFQFGQSASHLSCKDITKGTKRVLLALKDLIAPPCQFHKFSCVNVRVPSTVHICEQFWGNLYILRRLELGVLIDGVCCVLCVRAIRSAT